MRVLHPKYTFYYERYGLGGFFACLIFYAIAFCCSDSRKMQIKCSGCMKAVKYVSYLFLEMAFVMLHSGRFTSY